MGLLLLAGIVAMLFVLWLALVALSTCSVRIKRPAHRHGFYLAGHR